MQSREIYSAKTRKIRAVQHRPINLNDDIDILERASGKLFETLPIQCIQYKYSG